MIKNPTSTILHIIRIKNFCPCAPKRNAHSIKLTSFRSKVANDNLDMVGEFFDKLKNYFEKIFVISHNPMISNWANTVVKITKTENVSKVSQ